MFEFKIDGKVKAYTKRLPTQQWKRIARWDVSSHENWPFILGTMFEIHPKDVEEMPDGPQELIVGFNSTPTY